MSAWLWIKQWWARRKRDREWRAKCERPPGPNTPGAALFELERSLTTVCSIGFQFVTVAIDAITAKPF